MISVKGGTQTWSSAKQESSLKGDGSQNISASDKAKYFQDESIGDTLNKVADPNFIDESKKMRTTGNNQLGKDAFMTLLLTQMKNQDPTNPLKSHEMAAQLAQFTQLEKLNNINEGIVGLRKDNQPDHNFQALAFIGKTITTDNSKISRVDTESTHHVRFSLGADAQEAKMVVKDASGNPVRNIEFKNLKTGKQDLEWNGLTDEGAKAPAGDYTVSIAATGSNGRGLAVDMKVEGVISGVNFTPHGPQLMVGRQLVNMADVKSISETQAPQMETLGVPNAQMLQQLQQMMPPQGAPAAAPKASAQSHRTASSAGMMAIPHEGPKKAEVKPESKPENAKRAKLMKGDLNDAAMAQGLINQLNKTGAKAGMG
jgi:flagellar basal-body rod modification protein FlgD